MMGFAALGELPLAALLAADSITPGTTTLYFSDRDYISLSSDTLADTAFLGKVAQPLTIRRSIVGAGGGFWGLVNTQFGQVSLHNTDGAYDAIIESLGLDGRDIVVKQVAAGGSHDAAITIFKGTTSGWGDDDGETVSIPVRDTSFKLDVPLQSTFYTGAGGTEGGGDLTGKPKPVAVGKFWNEEPVYLGVVSGNHTYQICDCSTLGAMTSVDTLRVGGVEWTKVAGFSSPSTAEWLVDLTTGIITLGSDLSSTVTCDGQGVTAAGTSTSSIVKWLLETLTNVSTDVDGNAFSTFGLDEPGAVGLYIGADPVLAREPIERLLQGVAAWGGQNAQGLFTVGQLGAPNGVIRAGLTEDTMVRPLRRRALPAALNPAVWRTRVGYRRAGTVQTDIASGAAEADRQFASVEFRESIDADAAIQLKHLQAQELFIPGLYDLAADASSKAAAMLALFNGDPAIYEGFWAGASTLIDIGDTVRLTYPRWNLDGGKLGTVVGVSPNLQENEMGLEIFI